MDLKTLQCPRCSKEITKTGETLHCSSCKKSYPNLNGIPWLFSLPEVTLEQWKARLQGHLQQLDVSISRMKEEKKQKDLLKPTEERLTQLIKATHEQKEFTLRLLKDLLTGSSHEPSGLFKKVQKNQGISSYFTNVFRDWSWGEKENQINLDLLTSSLEKNTELGKLLVIGSGCSRLAYDLHQQLHPEWTLATDINPLLLSIAKKVIRGDSLSLYETPISPLELKNVAVSQKLKAPASIQDSSFEYLFCDGTDPPFQSKSWDTLLTPWFLDIVLEDLKVLSLRLNRILKKGGRWINLGPLGYSDSRESRRYLTEEVREILESSGFQISFFELKEIPYLQSPYSGYQRQEKVLVFSAEKVEHQETSPNTSYLPNWLLDTSQAIPLLAEFKAIGADHLIQAEILTSINGKSSIDELVPKLAKRYHLSDEESKRVLCRILTDAYEEFVLFQTR